MKQIILRTIPIGRISNGITAGKGYVLNEISEPKPESVEINEWISRLKAIKEGIEWTEEIAGTHFSKFYFFSRTKEAINNWKMELVHLQKEMDFTMTPSSPHNAEVMVANVSKGIRNRTNAKAL